MRWGVMVGVLFLILIGLQFKQQLVPPPVRGRMTIDLAILQKQEPIKPFFFRDHIYPSWWNKLWHAVPLHPLPIRGRRLIPVHKTKNIANPAKVNSVESDISDLALHSRSRQYVYVFQGRLTCDNQPCSSAEIHVALDTVKNPNIDKLIRPAADGTYEVRIPLSEIPQEQVNWTLRFVSSSGATQDIQGRQILMDDPTVTIERPADLRSTSPGF